MADKFIPSRDDASVIERYVDQGNGTWARMTASSAGASGAAGYPVGATPVAAAVSGANTVLTPTLPGVPGKITYITGLQITATGATASAATGASLAGVTGPTQTIIVTAPVGPTTAAPPIVINFNPPLPASAVNTPIILTVPALGAGNAACSASMQGFQL